MTTPVFPILRPGYSSHIRPTFATDVQTSVSGFEARSARQAYPLWEFEILFEILADATQNSVPDPYYNGYAELQQICGLFLVCAGQFGRFYYTCPEDNSRLGQYISTGDGATKIFTVIRYWGTGERTFIEPVGAVNLTIAPIVYFNGVLQNPAGYSISGNTLTFTAAPGAGAIITMDFHFYYLCRFLDDTESFGEFFHNLWELKSLKFRSTKS